MLKQSLSPKQITQLRQGLKLYMAELQKRIDHCNDIETHNEHAPGTLKLYENDYNDAAAMQNILNSCYTVTLE